MPKLKNSEELNNKRTKILILGLSNCGKTSISNSLQKINSLSSYCHLEPTRNYEIYDFQKYQIWDFGGQTQYREEHVHKLNEYIFQANKVIYVIDVQDIEKYDLTLKYLGRIVKILKTEDYHGNFSIFLHKFDPNLMTINTAINNDVIVHLLDQIKEIIPKGFDYIISKTTIYTVFNKKDII